MASNSQIAKYKDNETVESTSAEMENTNGSFGKFIDRRYLNANYKESQNNKVNTLEKETSAETEITPVHEDHDNNVEIKKSASNNEHQHEETQRRSTRTRRMPERYGFNCE